jgi:hypothetical protein
MVAENGQRWCQLPPPQQTATHVASAAALMAGSVSPFGRTCALRVTTQIFTSKLKRSHHRQRRWGSTLYSLARASLPKRAYVTVMYLTRAFSCVCFTLCAVLHLPTIAEVEVYTYFINALRFIVVCAMARTRSHHMLFGKKNCVTKDETSKTRRLIC